MPSASSSEISMSNSSSSSITNSTTSNESAPRSPVKEASSFTSFSSTPRRSTITFVTLSNTVANVVTSPQCSIQKTELHNHSAVKMQSLACHVGRFIRCEEQCGFRHLFRLAEAAEWNLRHHRLLNVIVQCICHFCRDKSWRHRIGCYASARQFARCRLRQTDDAGF